MRSHPAASTACALQAQATDHAQQQQAWEERLQAAQAQGSQAAAQAQASAAGLEAAQADLRVRLWPLPQTSWIWVLHHLAKRPFLRRHLSDVGLCKWSFSVHLVVPCAWWWRAATTSTARTSPCHTSTCLVSAWRRLVSAGNV